MECSWELAVNWRNNKKQDTDHRMPDNILKLKFDRTLIWGPIEKER